MFLVFGTPRSGTTLLKEALCQHSEIVIPHETDFIVPLALLLDRIPDPSIGRRLAFEMIVSTRDFSSSIGRYLTRQDVETAVYSSDYSFATILSSVYSALSGNLGKVIAGDKSPNDLAFVRILGKVGLFNSNIKFIHVVRDVRDVILSLKRTSWAPSDVEDEIPRIWTSTNLNLRRFAREVPDRYFFLRYEDFVSSPAEKLAELSHFLDVPFDSNMLAWQKMGIDLRHLAHHRNLGKPPLPQKCFEWKLRIPEFRSELERWTGQAEDALREFGYEHSI